MFATLGELVVCCMSCIAVYLTLYQLYLTTSRQTRDTVYRPLVKLRYRGVYSEVGYTSNNIHT